MFQKSYWFHLLLILDTSMIPVALDPMESIQRWVGCGPLLCPVSLRFVKTSQ